MNLSMKQRQHAEKLYYELDGNVSRREIEDSALSAKHGRLVKIDCKQRLIFHDRQTGETQIA